ncbi:bifunctional tetrahydrofolate synthase/dihydrofolate synthase [Marinobacter sp.]|uniref:bifunctional tetrahydrofolate synthase/dihydrofolate synthase n=1 Tax=Marinobacter sp. TaxID=50741 RepID=UPI00384DA706
MSLSSKGQGPVRPGPDASLDAWLSYLEALHPSEIDMGLDRVLLVLRRLMPGRPGGRIITVGGTNGKGSTVACIEALLLAAGRRVGTYTSPHLTRYNERIRVNGQDVDDASLISAFEKIEAARGSVSLTYFEFGTLAAFLVMQEAGLDDWVLEVGLGGRLDAVNVLDADLAIITSVDIDHAAWLGNDRETIGFEKAGILRQGRPAIYADQAPPGSVLQQARAQQVPLWRYGVDYSVPEDGSRVDIPELDRRVPLPVTPLPVTSLAAAVMAVLWLEPDLSDTTIFSTLARVRVPGRFECLQEHPRVVLDVGHNPHAARWLAARMNEIAPPPGKVFAVYACLEDKDSAGVVVELMGTVDHWILAGLSGNRGLGVPALESRLQGLLAAGTQHSCDTVTEGVNLALERASPEDLIIVFGSFYTVAEARLYLLSTLGGGKGS